MKKLYEITGQLSQLQEMIDDGQPLGELEDTLDMLNLEFDAKIDGCLKVVANLLAEAEMLKVEAAALTDRKRSTEAQIESLKRYIKDCMSKAGASKAGVLKQATLTKPRKILRLVDEGSLPDQYREQVFSWKTDKKAIEAALNAGDVIKGAELVDSEPGLRIK